MLLRIEEAVSLKFESIDIIPGGRMYFCQFDKSFQ